MKTGPLLSKILDSPISMDSCIVHWGDCLPVTALALSARGLDKFSSRAVRRRCKAWHEKLTNDDDDDCHLDWIVRVLQNSLLLHRLRKLLLEVGGQGEAQGPVHDHDLA